MKSVFFRSILLSFVFVLVVSSMAHAAIKPYSLTVTPHISALIFEGNEQLENSAVFGLSLGYNFSERWAGELTAAYSEMDLVNQPGEDVMVHSVRLDALYHFQPKEKIVPYFVIGAGGLTFDADNSTGESGDQDAIANYGFGIKFACMNGI